MAGDHDSTEEDDVSVAGLASHPETTRSSRDYVATFVNGRYVRSPALREAVLEAYGDQLAADRYPFVVLFVDVPPAAVDANVHPRKLEIRFDDEAGVRRAVREAVRDALLSHGLVRSSAPRGRSAPDETPVAPERTETDGSAPSDGDGAPAGPDGAGDEADASTAGWDAAGHDAAATAGTTPSDRGATVPDGADASTTDGDDSDVTDATAGADPDADAAPDGKFGGPVRQTTLGGGPGPADDDREFETLPPMRLLGQVHDSYVVAETADGLLLVDQHAADERVRYERLRDQFAGDTAAQVLADPVEVPLTAVEAADLEAHREALARLGFRSELADDGRHAVVRTVPAVLDDALDPDALPDVLAEVVATDRSGAETVAALADELLADLACYPAVTGNTPLSEGDVTALLAALDGCENPYACPHGRPVVIRLSTDELEERFERDYPGHP